MERIADTYGPETPLYFGHNYGANNYLWTQDLLLQMSERVTDKAARECIESYQKAVEARVSKLMQLRKAKMGSTGFRLGDELECCMYFRVLDKLDKGSQFKKALALFDGKDQLDEVEAMTFVRTNHLLFDDLTPEEKLRNQQKD